MSILAKSGIEKDHFKKQQTAMLDQRAAESQSLLLTK